MTTPSWLSAIESIGEGIVSTAVPGGAAIVAGINALLPDDKKLPPNATGSQVTDAVSALPPEQQAQVREKMLDLTITKQTQAGDALKAMFASDATSKQTTRPYIAKGCFLVIAFCNAVVISLWAYAVGANLPDMIKAIESGWPFIVGVNAPLVYVLKAYFGAIQVEHGNKVAAATGQPLPVAGGIAALVKAFKG